VFAVQKEPPFEVRLQNFRNRIGPEDWGARIDLARWLLSEGRADLALEELKLIRGKSESEEVAHLTEQAESMLRLRAPPSSPAPAAPQSGPNRSDAFPRLTNEDINLIRVMEVDLRKPPRMRATEGLAARICEDYAKHPLLPPAEERAQMAKWPTVRLLALLFEMKARDLYGMVRVEEDPDHLQIFRKRVHDAWLIPNCATSRCHGGRTAGRFMLCASDPSSARTAYTNLMILLKFRTTDGLELINFESPAQSALLSYAAPRNQVVPAHPAVQGWQPLSGTQRQALQIDATNWIRGMHVPPHSMYPVELNLPEAAEPAAKSREDR
jgi:hypothetical protein